MRSFLFDGSRGAVARLDHRARVVRGMDIGTRRLGADCRQFCFITPELARCFFNRLNFNGPTDWRASG